MSQSVVVLHRPPAALALPSADPCGLAVEAMLRMLRVKYTSEAAHYRDLALTLPKAAAAFQTHGSEGVEDGGEDGGDGNNNNNNNNKKINNKNKNKNKKSGSAVVTVRGVEAALQGLAAAVDRAVLPEDQRPAAACVSALAAKCLFPAFRFLTLYDPTLFHHALRKSVVPKVATAWEMLRGTFRENALRENPYFYGEANAGGGPPASGRAASLTQRRVMESILAEVENALKSLELLHVASASSSEGFFLGTARPCSVDAYAYAGVSAFLHADFTSAGHPSAKTSSTSSSTAMASASSGEVLSPILAAFQRKMRLECPLLLRYVERVRRLLFENESGVYNLWPSALSETIENADAKTAAYDLYAKGRLRTLLWTGAFAFAYFLVANADILAAIAGELEEELEEEEEEEERAEAQRRATTAHPQAQ